MTSRSLCVVALNDDMNHLAFKHLQGKKHTDLPFDLDLDFFEARLALATT